MIRGSVTTSQIVYGLLRGKVLGGCSFYGVSAQAGQVPYRPGTSQIGIGGLSSLIGGEGRCATVRAIQWTEAAGQLTPGKSKGGRSEWRFLKQHFVRSIALLLSLAAGTVWGPASPCAARFDPAFLQQCSLQSLRA